MTEERDVLCKGTNLDGSACTRYRRRGEVTCPHHDPQRVEERAAKLEAKAAAVRAGVPA